MEATADPTVNALLVADLPPPAVETVIPVPAFVRVTSPVHTPFAKAPVFVGAIVPVVSVSVFVPV